jgi:hypothetical protein
MNKQQSQKSSHIILTGENILLMRFRVKLLN